MADKAIFCLQLCLGGHMKPGEQMSFDNVKNFQDLGGYAAADNRHVKYGLLFRGPALCGLSESDTKKIDEYAAKAKKGLKRAAQGRCPEYNSPRRYGRCSKCSKCSRCRT